MFRKVRQWAAGAEITAFAKQLDVLEERVLQDAHNVEGLKARLDRLSNRVNMRLTRAGAPGVSDELRIMQEMALAARERQPGDELDFEPDILDHMDNRGRR